ncbi:endonuclease/exonuclease/phosphatase family protein [Streptomyces sp. DSM 42041]|uniref:Endonuclease/exonuclease/phosphatase family protein n=1 Tax=Streptomyces hazeniae TaxID=3075538 RepID=A0ABU2NNF1_9ACTN|nr:endonuclease/exonuclease/phosphatase family protein [Streptomyces sp. DSM 42041]MDT0378504.1 endonuclease/exonuclease/phosphatase family protein [Streptomyces sp. DSM 42041]
MRVMTWNLWWRFGGWERRWKAIRQVLLDVRPDVLGLQEVWSHGDDCLADHLAADLGMYCVRADSDAPGGWQRRLDDPDAHEIGVGNAVLSRWPVVDRARLRLPTDGGRADGRLSLHALIDAPGGRPVPFFTTHLNSGAHESAVRCAQVRALAAFVAEHRAGTDFPPVLTGDYNAWPDSDEMRLLGGLRTAPPVGRQVFLDAWEFAAPGLPAVTWDAANPYVAARRDPSVRIDYVHVGPPGPGNVGHVRSVRRAGDGPVDGVWPSDHLAVVADLALEEED